MRKRQGSKKNAKLLPEEVSNFCIQTEESKAALERAVERYGFSPRAISSCLKTARTIADLAQSERIEVPHMQEAIDLHKLCASLVPEL